MIQRIVFPVFDANITEGMVSQWHVSQGDRITPGDPLAEIVTDKATFTLESEVEGVVRKIVAPEKSVVPNHYILALVGEPGEAVPDVTAENEAIVEQSKQAMTDGSAEVTMPEVAPSPPRRPQGPSRRVRATPAARRLAKENDIDLATIDAEQPITEQAVREHIEKSG